MLKVFRRSPPVPQTSRICRFAFARQGGEESGLGFDAGGGAGQFPDGVANLLAGQRFKADQLLGQGVEHEESVGTEGEVC
jgi:hypothetical protein